MKGHSPVGLTLVLIGAALAVIGVMVWLGLFSWFGHLPGDIRVERPNVKVYAPIVSLLILSAVLSLVLSLIRRLL